MEVRFLLCLQHSNLTDMMNMMTRLSDRALERLNFWSLMGAVGFCAPFGYFGEASLVISWVVCGYLWIQSDVAIAIRLGHIED